MVHILRRAEDLVQLLFQHIQGIETLAHFQIVPRDLSSIRGVSQQSQRPTYEGQMSQLVISKIHRPVSVGRIVGRSLPISTIRYNKAAVRLSLNTRDFAVEALSIAASARKYDQLSDLTKILQEIGDSSSQPPVVTVTCHCYSPVRRSNSGRSGRLDLSHPPPRA
jgi:hypothetical protein